MARMSYTKGRYSDHLWLMGIPEDLLSKGRVVYNPAGIALVFFLNRSSVLPFPLAAPAFSLKGRSLW